MVYYKIPLTGGLDYPVGCILICAYTYNGYEYCKFEKVTEVGPHWVSITESEFNVRCPDFPAPNCPVEAESKEHPGCYYRIVNGETEWINPPMVAGVEYRTDKRHNGNVVYTKLIDYGTIKNASIDTKASSIISFRGITTMTNEYGTTFHDNSPVHSSKGEFLANAYVQNTSIVVQCATTFAESDNYTALFTIEYTK